MAKISFRTNEEFANSIHAFIQSGDLHLAANAIKSSGDPEVAATNWIGVQCDINNVFKDVNSSEQIAWLGVSFSIENGMTKKAASLLHNISAFYTPDWDAPVDPAVAAVVLKAAQQQVPLRRELSAGGEDLGPLGWGLWDLGMAQLINGLFESAIESFQESIEVHNRISNRNGAAWSQLFQGKAMLRQTLHDQGIVLIQSAAATILEIGEDWEKEELRKVTSTIGIEI